MLFNFLLVLQTLVAASMVGVILLQRSEGGGLGVGGSPTGLMSARGAADFLTRATAVLATIFVLICVALATIASLNNRTGKVDATAATPAQTAPLAAPTPAPVDPLAATAGQAAGNSTAPATK